MVPWRRTLAIHVRPRRHSSARRIAFRTRHLPDSGGDGSTTHETAPTTNHRQQLSSTPSEDLSEVRQPLPSICPTAVSNRPSPATGAGALQLATFGILTLAIVIICWRVVRRGARSRRRCQRSRRADHLLSGPWCDCFVLLQRSARLRRLATLTAA